MEKLDKNARFLIYSICFLIFFNIALTLRIPYILPFIGFIALCFIPGFLLYTLFNIGISDDYEKYLFYVGLSIAFDIFFGLIINTICPILGEYHPLSTQNLQICFSIILLLLIIVITIFKRTPEISFKIPKLLIKEKLILTFACTIVILSEIGIYLINQSSTNILFIFSIFLLPLLLVVIIICHNSSMSRIYPIILFLIGFSLIMALALRSNLIIGDDSHEEFFFFATTLTQAIWIPDPSFILSAALSISILPTIFENFLYIDSQLLFKILYPVLFSVTPLVVFTIVKRYTSELFALIASCFLIFQQSFIYTTSNSRTSLAIFFLAFAILVLGNQRLLNPKKYALIILFMIATIFAHYTTSIIFLFMLITTYIFDVLISGPDDRKRNRFINVSLIVFFAGFIFFWYHKIITTVFRNGLLYALARPSIFQDLIYNDVNKYNQALKIVPSVFLRFANYTRYIMYIFIFIGVSYAICRYIQKRFQKKSAREFPLKIDKEIVYLGSISFALLFLTVFAPILFFGYDTDRIWQLVSLILPIFLVTGTCTFFNFLLQKGKRIFSEKRRIQIVHHFLKYVDSHQEKLISGILLILLTPQLFIITGINDQFYQGKYSLLLNSPQYEKNVFYDTNNSSEFYFTFDQDAVALRWFDYNTILNASIGSDYYGNKKITSLIGQRSTLYQESILMRNNANIQSVFLSVSNGFNDIMFITPTTFSDNSSFNYILDQKNKIFSNGANIYM